MKIYVPKYYKNFKCIADRCRHSCCIDWEIDIDKKTYEKYMALDTDFGKDLIGNIESCGEDRYFKLSECGRCPNLDERGLCKIILTLGEEYLSDICRLHPRFFNDVGERREVGLGLVCEEAVKIILDDCEPFELALEEETSETSELPEFNPIPKRDALLALIGERGKSLSQKLSAIEDEYLVSVDIHTEKEWLGILSELEILDPEWKNILKNSVSGQESDVSRFDVYFERFLTYLIFRHVTQAVSYDNFRARVGFVSLSVKLVRYILARESNLTKERIFDIIRLYSSEIEYSEDNTADLIFEFEAGLAHLGATENDKKDEKTQKTINEPKIIV